MRKGQLRQLLLSLAGGIAVFLLLALVLHWNYFLSAALGVGVYFGLWFLLTPRPDAFTLYLAGRPDGEEVRARMEGAGRDLARIWTCARTITDMQTQADALALTETGTRIYTYLRKQPEKISTAYRFLTYYLDTVGRILDQYVRYQEANLHTADVRRFQQKVRDLLPKLKTGFEEQLAQLMASERFDVEADMKVMEGLLNTEGIRCETKPDGSDC